VALKKLSQDDINNRPRNEKTLYSQRITPQGTIWDWWRDGRITRDDEFTEFDPYYSPKRFDSVMLKHDGKEAFPPKGRIIRRSAAKPKDDDEIEF
jgi:hypothetical protein